MTLTSASSTLAPRGRAAFSTAYHHPTRTWQWFGQGNGAPQLQGPAFRMEATSVVREPGYLPSAQAGLEMIGYTKRLDYNPETPPQPVLLHHRSPHGNPMLGAFLTGGSFASRDRPGLNSSTAT